MARERGTRSSEAFPEPDMLPLMNIILMLILALITMAALLPLGLLSSEAQRLSKGGASASEQNKQPPLNLTLFVVEGGFNFSVYGEVKMGAVDPNNKARKLALIPSIKQEDGQIIYDFEKLQAKLIEFHNADNAKYDKRNEQSMTITADPEVKFDVIIQVMDAARYDGDKNELFPKVSFAAGLVG